jgi:hypothetical protein
VSIKHWDVDDTDQTYGVNPITVTMDSAHTATAHYFEWVTVSGTKYEDIDGLPLETTNPLQDWTMKMYAFCDDFEEGDSGWVKLSGTWSVIDDCGDKVYSGTATGDEQITYALSAGTYSDFTIEAELKAVNSMGHYGLILREDGSGNHYGFYLNAYPSSQGKYWFGYWDGSYNPIVGWTDSGGAYTDANTWNKVKVIANGYEFKLYINGILVNTVTDTTEYAASGYAGLIIDYYSLSGYQNTYFDDFCIYDSTVTNIDGYYEFTIKKPGTYALKEELLGGWTQTHPADGYTITIDEEDAGTTITSQDFWNFEWFKASGIKYEQALCDGFEDGDASDWEEVNGVWTVIDESGNMVLEQSLPYYVPGVRVAGQTSWTNYVVQAKVKVTGTSDRWGGILLRVDDPGTPTTAGTYYELYLQEKGYLQLTKTVSGVRTWPGGSWNSPQFRQYIGPFYNEWWNIKAEVVDGNIRGKAWQVGDPEPENWLINWLDATDPILSGKVGLITFSTENGVPVYFDDICVYKPLDGWTIELWDDSSVVGSTATDAYGYYEFVVKTPGSYDILEYLESGWSELYPEFHIGDDSLVLGYSFNAESGVDVTDYDFVNFEHAIVIVTKEDTEGDPVEDWEITIDGQIDYTEADGTVSFTLSQPGMYTVTEESRADWTAIGDTSYDFTAHSGGEYVFTFVNFKWMKIHGHKYFDGNGDGIWNNDEPYLDGWTINLADNGNIESAITGDVCNNWDTGYYKFTITEPGTYMVSENVNTDIWTKTEPACGYYQVDVQSGVDVERNFGNWLGPSEITTSNLCWFDMDETERRQFKILFTPDVNDDPNLYKVSATNPGQFYYNVFYSGVVGTSDTFSITLAENFETQGANPVHIYSSLNGGAEGCLTPINDVSHLFNIAIISENTITVTPNPEYDGFIYINVHCDYGLKQTGGYEQHLYEDGDGIWRAHAEDGIIVIYDLFDHTFIVSGPVSDSEIIQNRNDFKKIRGIAGIIQESGVGVKDVDVTITGPSLPDGEVIVHTDEYGFYGYSFHHTGKKSEYTIDPDRFGYDSVSTYLKAGRFAEVSFIS